ncbi:hypothetical protein ROZALSC1DRAFT_27150, partial [Rozella allomycis CSF55]
KNWTTENRIGMADIVIMGKIGSVQFAKALAYFLNRNLPCVRIEIIAENNDNMFEEKVNEITSRNKWNKIALEDVLIYRREGLYIGNLGDFESMVSYLLYINKARKYYNIEVPDRDNQALFEDIAKENVRMVSNAN